MSEIIRCFSHLAFLLPAVTGLTKALRCASLLLDVLVVTLLIVAVNITATPVVDATEHAKPQSWYFDIPAQSLSRALLVFSRQCDKTIVVANELVAKKTSPELTGYYSVNEALRLLLKESGLSFFHTSDGGIVVTRMKKPTLVQQITNPDISDSIEEVLVKSHLSKAANRKIIAFKRQSLTIADSYPESNINGLPDLNIADSFRRLPGTSVINDSDEGRYVNVRGIDSSLNFVTLDGMAIATDEETSRSINLEAIPATAMSALEVVKVQTADMDANAIGGTLNMVSRSAYDSDNAYLFFKSQLSEYTLDDVPDNDDGIGGSFDGVYTDTFGPDKQWGVVMSASYNLKNRDEQKTSNDIYGYDTPLGSPVNNRIRTLQYTNTWKRYGGSIKLEYQPDENFHVYLNTFYYTMKEKESRYLESLERGEGLAQFSTTTGQVAQAENRFRYTYRPTARDNGGSHLQLTYKPGVNKRFSAAVAYSKATLRLPYHDVYYRTGVTEQLGYVYDMSGLYTHYQLNSPAYITNPDNYGFDLAQVDFFGREDSVQEYRLDYAVNTTSDSQGWGYKVGTKYRRLNRSNDVSRQVLEVSSGNAPRFANFTAGSRYVPEHYDHPVFTFDYQAFRNNIAQNPSSYQFVEDSYETTRLDFSFRETVTSVYAMLTHAAPQYYFSAGVRYEDTHHSSSGWSGPENRLMWMTDHGRSDSVLPCLYFHYDLSESVRLRTGFSRSIARANPDSLLAQESVSIDKDGFYRYLRGNPDLLPRNASNYDVAVEYYFDNGDSILAATVFKKDIKNLIYSDTFQEIIDGERVRVEQAKNADRAYVNGVEISLIKTAFTSLPRYLRGLGISANATWIDAGMNSFDQDGKKIRIGHLKDQADFTANVTLSYRYKYWSLRVAYHYMGAYADDFRSDANEREETWWEPYEQVDVSTTIDLTESLSMNFSIRNLTDHFRLRTVGENRALFSEEVKYGRSYWLGITYQY